jgi:hypothetical protein
MYLLELAPWWDLVLARGQEWIVGLTLVFLISVEYLGCTLILVMAQGLLLVKAMVWV